MMIHVFSAKNNQLLMIIFFSNFDKIEYGNHFEIHVYSCKRSYFFKAGHILCKQVIYSTHMDNI